MEQEVTLDLHELFNVLRKRAKLIFGTILFFVIFSIILSFFVLKPVYEAKVTVIIGKEEQNTEKRIDYNDIMMYQKLVKTYAGIAKSRTVVEKTIKDLNMNIDYEKFLDKLSVTPQPDTQIMDIKFQSKDPHEAMLTANKLTDIFLEESKRIYPTNTIQVMDYAVLPEKPVKPKKLLNIAIAFVIGVMVSLGLVFMLEYMDNTIKTENDVEKVLELPVIGIIPKYKE
ncbi:Capsular polysaccharide biosynthesis protein [Caloramator fervidus]|uniref:Capsular polysaccharide biosynthesis protein n=1 Tax=Caloramator fervidus TaxID=29344 RepID=A0A1H5T0D5_9CLOT|nr:Wzz/FepE/Etk N-terminal domain-containing protein [Caloramator fervidus]SEF56184.1 Capsular polysaccharide biosynthesis protein [Caloramator fervidus]